MLADLDCEPEIGSSGPNLETSIPVTPLKNTKPLMFELYFSYSAFFAYASSSVRPSSGVNVAKNFTSFAFRPAFSASRRPSSTLTRRASGVGPAMKIASA